MCKKNDLILNDHRPHCSVDQPSLLYNFSHIFSSPEGFASCCYSYMWGKELEADAFTRFINEGIINEKVGIEFRDKILAMGNSILSSKLFKNFMGRDPEPKALLIREGIKG
ncbi:hypothetical protein M9Y10_007670 [Tritrichomonas musculus]|uniref:Peptidase M3A/M3B catalytic domain-containing protein n=1 Tax=Tritrichomonas musculus TaxID=1915356 RepID=A0ABR2J228_9EUKA